MQSQLIYECPVLLPTLSRAAKLVPPEFIPCYEWFQKHAGETISRLPHRMLQAPATPIPLSRDSGIYIPSAARVTYDGGRKYALSVHSSGTSRYADRKPIPLADGTWVLDYAAHEGSASNQGYNIALLNCLNDGIPVGVMYRESAGYRVLGLAFIERYNNVTHMFTLHGPISNDSESKSSFALPGFDEIPPDEQQLLVEYDGADERQIVMAQQVRRERQGKFRDALLRAYAGTCVITGTNVPEVLQAAHINPYRGRKSQIVNNGLLLRADLHLLYDAYLISVDPDTLSVALSERLGGTDYLRYNRKRLNNPIDMCLSPNPELLAMHYEQFRQENATLVA